MVMMRAGWPNRFVSAGVARDSVPSSAIVVKGRKIEAKPSAAFTESSALPGRLALSTGRGGMSAFGCKADMTRTLRNVR
jgi:hypothetical protein